MRDSQTALKRMSIGDVIDYSIEIYKRNFKKLTTLALIFYIPFIFVFSLVISYLSADVENIKSNSGDLENLSYMFMAYYLTILGMLLLYLVYSLTIKSVFDASVAKTVYFDTVHNKQLELKVIISECFKKFKTLFVNRILYYLIIFGVGIGLYILLFIVLILVVIAAASFGYMIDNANPAMAVAAGIGIVLLFVLVSIPAIILISYFFAKYGMGVHSIIIENKSASEAVSRCNQISKKSFWSISFSFVLGTTLFFAIPTMLSVGVQALTSFNKVLFIAANTAAQIVWALLNPYLSTLLTVIFINQKIKNEGLDLELKVDNLIAEAVNTFQTEETGENTDDKA